MKFNKRIIAFSVLFSLLSQASLVKAAPICSRLLLSELDHSLLSEIQIVSNTEIRNNLERFIIKNNLSEINFYDQKHLQRLIAKELRTASNMDSLDRRFQKSFESRSIESIEWTMAERIITNGSIDFFNKNPRTKNYLPKMISFIQSIASSKIANLLGIPFSLPAINNKPIPEELHQNILLFGLEKNKQAILNWYKQQNIREGYQTLERIYAPIGISILIYYFLITHQEKELENKIRINSEYENFQIEQNRSNTEVKQVVNAEIQILQDVRMKEFIRLYELQNNKMPSSEVLSEVKLLIQQSNIK